MAHSNRRRSSFFMASPLPPTSIVGYSLREAANETTDPAMYISAPPLPSSARTSSVETETSRRVADESESMGPLAHDTADDASTMVLGLKLEFSEDEPTPLVALSRQNSLPPMIQQPNLSNNVEHQEGPDRHFLQGINLESCQNLLSIPDPPTPSRVRSRRQSSPMVRPLQDLSANVKNQSTPSTAANLLPPGGKPKRPRKSLGHVPAPERTIVDTAEDGTTETFLVAAAMQLSEQVSLDASDPNTGIAKRRKKRQTIFLPSDPAPGNQEYFRSFVTFKKAATTKDEGRPVQNVENTGLPLKDSKQHYDLVELRRLVHAYTALPTDARDKCQEIKAIQEISDYVVTPPVTSLLGEIDVTKQPAFSTHASKMDLLVQMSPKLQRMDEKKVQEVTRAARVTECRVERKKGRYVYVHMPSGRKITAHEYEQRHKLMLEETNKIRGHAWTLHFTRLQSLLLTAAQESQQAAAAKELLLHDMPSPPQDQPHFDTDESMELCETSTSLDLGDENLMDDETDTTCLDKDATVADHDTDAEAPLLRSPTDVVDLPPPPQQVSGSPAAVTSSPNESVLPFPCREEESSDPEIAAAEQRLWGAIDLALEEYSRQVLAIQSARQSGVALAAATNV